MATEYSTDSIITLPDSGQDDPSQGGLNIKRLLRLRLPMMIAVFLVLAIPSVTAVWFLTPTQYKATTQIRFAQNAPGIMEEDSGASRGYAEQMATEINIAKSPTILTRVLAEPELRGMKWITESEDPLYTLSGKVSVGRRAEIMEISVTAPTRGDALTIAQTIEDVYLADALGREAERGGTRLDVLYDQQDNYRGEVNALRERIRTMRRDLDMPVIDLPGRQPRYDDPYQDQFARAQATHIEATRTLAMLERQLEQLRALQEKVSQDPSQKVYAYEIESAVTNDPRIRSLQQSLISLEKEIAVKKQTYKENHPQIRVMEKQRQAIEEEIAQTEQRLRLEYIDTRIAKTGVEVDNVKNRVNIAEESEDRFDQQLAERRQEDIELSQQWADIRSEEGKLSLARNKLESINRIIESIRLESRAPASIQRLGGPSAPNSPDYSRLKKLLAMAVLGSGAAGAGLGLFRELTDQQVRSVQDVSYVTRLPILAAIPHHNFDSRLNGASQQRLTAEQPISSSADEYRRILSRIIYPPEGSAELNTCLVTSPSRGDGKTSLACNLAVSLSKANRRVLLLDISSRNPGVEEALDLEIAEGLSEILVGEDSPSELIRPTSFGNLFVLGPGFRGEELVGKLASRDIVELLEKAEENFEHVIIDTPPALLMADAKLLAPIVDGVVMVCGAQVSTIGMLRRCLGDLQHVGANIVGVAVNGLRPQRGGYLERNVNLYYDYSNGRSPLYNGHKSKDAKGGGESGEGEEPMILLVDDGSDSGGSSRDA